MKKFLAKAKSAFKSSGDPFSAAASLPQKVVQQTDTPSTVQLPSPLEILRYRYHYGTNLGSIFVLEQWLFGSMFVSGATGGSELDAVKVSLSQSGLDATRQKWENHWNTAVSASDFDWLVNTAHCTSIRLPVGYFTLGPAYCSDTPFEGQAAEVYLNAWAAVKAFVSAARSHGIGVLIDFHALPGGANRDAHSGTSSGQAALWGNQANLSLAQRCLLFMAQEIRDDYALRDGVVGLQLCNEAIANAPGMYAWYDSVIAAIGQVDNSILIYISDAWDLSTAIAYTNGKNSLQGGAANPVVIDTHLYYCFSDADKDLSPEQIIARIPGELGPLDGRDGSVVNYGAAQVIVGEYSCVLDEKTWAKVDASQRAELITWFGRAQCGRWQQRSGGCYFWTDKMDWMDGGEWGFVQQTKSTNIAPASNLVLSSDQIKGKLATAQDSRDSAEEEALNAHRNYWNQHAPGSTMEHWRFSAGWALGFSDAMSFFQARVLSVLPGPGADMIGMLDLWVKKRIVESGQGGQYLWEFEQGLRQGVAAFYRLCDV